MEANGSDNAWFCSVHKQVACFKFLERTLWFCQMAKVKRKSNKGKDGKERKGDKSDSRKPSRAKKTNICCNYRQRSLAKQASVFQLKPSEASSFNTLNSKAAVMPNVAATPRAH